jgi:hypothetical protein
MAAAQLAKIFKSVRTPEILGRRMAVSLPGSSQKLPPSGKNQVFPKTIGAALLLLFAKKPCWQ